MQSQKNRFRVKTPPPLLVLTYNFATALKETTTYNLKTLTTRLLLTPSFQNCELKQEPCTLATAFRQPLKFHNRERSYFFTFAGWVKLFRNSDFGANFCFNSKPSFSFDSWRQRTKFPVASNYSCNHKKNRFRVKTNKGRFFHLTFFHYALLYNYGWGKHKYIEC